MKHNELYPYEYMRDFEKLYSWLINKKISDNQYEHVVKVWNTFSVKRMKDYCNLYLKFYVLLLADFFEKFRNKSLKNYESCPSHYLNAPTLSWDAMLNIIKVELELISDADT